MSLSDNPPLSIMDLNADCLFEIFDRLPIRDVLSFRLQCSAMNDAVCKYLRQIPKLSIVYTEHGSEGIPSKNLRKDEKYWNPGDTYFNSDWLDEAVADFTRKLTWKKNLIVIFGREKFQKFLEFINKFEIRNIKKLSIIVDPDPNEVVILSPATQLLKLCPKVQTLFLERANRYTIKLNYFGFRTDTGQSVFKSEDLGDLFDTIIGLASLSELHFFTSHYFRCEIFLTPHSIIKPSIIPADQVKQMFGTFVSKMFQKLRIFGFNQYGYARRPALQEHPAPLLEQNFENILELGFEDTDFIELINSDVKFPNLRSLTLFNGGCRFGEFNIGNSFEKLTTLRFINQLELTEQSMLNLNSLQNLETLSAKFLWVSNRDIIDVNFRRNRRIKHIQVEQSARRSSDEVDPIIPLYPFTHFFQALETITVSPPKADKVVHDRNTLNNLRIEFF